MKVATVELNKAELELLINALRQSCLDLSIKFAGDLVLDPMKDLHLNARCMFDQLTTHFTTDDVVKLTELMHKKALAKAVAEAPKPVARFELCYGDVVQGLETFVVYDNDRRQRTNHRVLDRESGNEIIKMLTKLHAM